MTNMGDFIPDDMPAYADISYGNGFYLAGMCTVHRTGTRQDSEEVRYTTNCRAAIPP